VRTRTEHVVIPEERFDRTIYGCDHCDFEDDTEEAVKNHHAKNHAVKKEQEINGTKFYWFESKEDAELWLDPPGDWGGTADFTGVDWKEPGWYGTESKMGNGRCRCGGCTYFETTLRPVAWFVENWRKSITANESNTEAKLAAIEAASKL
jgi:hypothetical protein